MENQIKQMTVYQAENGAVEVQFDAKKETVLLTQQQVGQLFNVQKAAISKHIKNIFKTGELSKDSTVSILEIVQFEGRRKVTRKVEHYNLDLVLSIGYRVNSINATKFRQWATKILHSYIINGYTFNKKRLVKNYTAFLRAVETVKKLLPSGEGMNVTNTLELVKIFASTWFSLDAYDRLSLPKSGVTKKRVEITEEHLVNALTELRDALVSKKEAGELFGKERTQGSVAGIIGNVFQSFGGVDLYQSIEEKAANILYFMVKNHPFIDGNKRNGAFAFIWYLRQAGILNLYHLSPQALTAITLLVAESKTTEKQRMIGLILMLLKT